MTVRITSVLTGLLMFLGWSCLTSADLGLLDKLVMPGKLSRAHAKFENNCGNCHLSFKKSAQSDVCLDCHDHADVTEDVASGRGFHGRIEEKKCSVCHTEHEGRNMNIAPLNKKTFDHYQTDFSLENAHADAKIKCEDCHKPGLKFRDAPSACYSCHKKDDVHKGKLGEDCVNCHLDSDWKEIRFDHSKTDFPLEGKHLFAKCESCHVDERYKKTPKDCYACHKSDDNKKGHKGQFGEKCGSCHIPEDWGISLFNHDKDTNFPLTGKHRLAKCTDCHKRRLYEEKPQASCYACHKRDDDKKGHKGRFGTKCETCHIPREWERIIFDHSRDTDYPLRGEHRKVECTACHMGILYKEDLKTDCFSCHEQDDAHKGQQGARCGRCHNEQSWKEKVFFDHGLTRFPLLGKHAKAECKDCHQDTAYKDADIACVSCHEKDDVHKRRLGPLCDQCHNPKDWRRWHFDHNTQTDFPLDGAHEGLDCHACHTTPVKKKVRLATDCVTCHRDDDVHQGDFGHACARCHVTSSFSDVDSAIGVTQ